MSLVNGKICEIRESLSCEIFSSKVCFTGSLSSLNISSGTELNSGTRLKC